MERQQAVESNRLIGLFHTARSNIDVFDREAFSRPRLGRPLLRHWVRPELLERAETAGQLTDEIRNAAIEAMQAAVSDLRSADPDGRLVCTCSTLGPAADDLAAAGLPVARADRAVAEAAFDRARHSVAALVAVDTTVGPTTALFEAARARCAATASFIVIAVPDAWPRFRAGDSAGYAHTIAAAADQAARDHDTVALAQSSMAPAAALCDAAVLTVPDCALDAAFR